MFCCAASYFFSVFQDFAIKYWIQKGAPPSKLNVGMGTYGRTFTLQNTRNTEVGAAITGPGQAGPYTREAGTLGYNEVCSKINQSH
jgi:chitinase